MPKQNFPRRQNDDDCLKNFRVKKIITIIMGDGKKKKKLVSPSSGKPSECRSSLDHISEQGTLFLQWRESKKASYRAWAQVQYENIAGTSNSGATAPLRFRPQSPAPFAAWMNAFAYRVCACLHTVEMRPVTRAKTAQACIIRRAGEWGHDRNSFAPRGPQLVCSPMGHC